MLRMGNFIICKFNLNAIDFLDYWTFPKLTSWLLRRWKHFMLRILFTGNPFHVFLSHIGVWSLIGLLFSLTLNWGNFGARFRKFQLSQTAGKRNLSKVRRRKGSVISDSDRKVGMITRAFADAISTLWNIAPSLFAYWKYLSAFRSHPECHFLSKPPAMTPLPLLQYSASVSSEHLAPFVNKHICCQCICFMSVSLSTQCFLEAGTEFVCVYPVLPNMQPSAWHTAGAWHIVNEGWTKGAVSHVYQSAIAAKQTTPKLRGLKQQPCLLSWFYGQFWRLGWALLHIPTDPGHLGNYSHLRAWDSMDHQPHTHTYTHWEN